MCRQASMAACAAGSDSNGATSLSNSSSMVLWERSIFPVVVDDLIFVKRYRILSSRQMRSKSTSTG